MSGGTSPATSASSATWAPPMASDDDRWVDSEPQGVDSATQPMGAGRYPSTRGHREDFRSQIEASLALWDQVSFLSPKPVVALLVPLLVVTPLVTQQ
jgi:hypothetical protein